LLRAEEIVYGNQRFGLLLYFLFADGDQLMSDCIADMVLELYLAPSSPAPSQG
jgi:hypothetical protein